MIIKLSNIFTLIIPFFTLIHCCQGQKSPCTYAKFQIEAAQESYNNASENDTILLKKSISISKKILSFPNSTKCSEIDSIQIEALLLISLSYSHMNKIQLAYNAAEQAVMQMDTIANLNLLTQIKIFNQYAYLLDLAFSKLEEALIVRRKITRLLDQFPIDIQLKEYENLFFDNIIRTCDMLDRYGKSEEAFLHIDKTIDIINQYEISLHNHIKFDMFLVSIYIYQSKYPQAQKKITEILELSKKSNVLDTKILGRIQIYQGELHFQAQNFQAAESAYRQALYYHLQTSGINSYETQFTIQSIIICLINQNKTNEAITLIEKFYKNTSSGDLNSLYKYYENLGNVYWHSYLTDDTNIKALHKVITYHRLERDLVIKKWQKFTDYQDLYYQLHEERYGLRGNLQILHAAYTNSDSIDYGIEAITYNEFFRNISFRVKSIQEIISLNENSSRIFFEKEKQLAKKIFELKSSLNNKNTELERKVINDSLLEYQLERQQYLKEINERYPNYQELLWSITPFTLDEIQNYCVKNKKTILYYFSSISNYYCVAISSNSYSFKQIHIQEDSLNNLVDQLRIALYTNPGQPSNKDLLQLANTSRQLYQLLLAPIEDMATDRLVIIPDGPLEVIPFSLLLSKDINIEDVPLKNWPFAIRDYSFSYAYSLDLLLRPQEEEKADVQKKILAFAPNFQAGMLRGDSTRFQGELKSNQDEVAFIDDQFACQAYYEDQALLSTFRKEAPLYSVLHLATHASANTKIGDYSFLAFSEVEQYDHHLEVGELYGMHIPAELVVLSACETGLGEWQRGEGVIGLERAFSYAGAKSLVTTHWKVSDRASAKLMSQFYDKLATGLQKDIALQQAQLAYINGNENWLSHPFFWAGFVQKGNTSPLDIPRKQNNWPWILGLSLIIVGLGYRKFSQLRAA